MNFFFFWGGGGAGGRVGRGGGWVGMGGRVGGQGGCDRRIELFLENSPKKSGRGSGGVRWGGGGRVGGEMRVDVNAMLGVGGDVGYEGCEPSIEGIEQCTKWYCAILENLKNVGGGGGAIFEPKTLSMYLKKIKK